MIGARRLEVLPRRALLLYRLAMLMGFGLLFVAGPILARRFHDPHSRTEGGRAAVPTQDNPPGRASRSALLPGGN